MPSSNIKVRQQIDVSADSPSLIYGYFGVLKQFNSHYLTTFVSELEI